MVAILFFLGVSIGMGWWAGSISKEKGQGFALGFALGFVLGILGLIIVSLMSGSGSSRKKLRRPGSRPGTRTQTRPISSSTKRVLRSGVRR